MRRRVDPWDALGIGVILAGGLAALIIWPRKTFDLVVRGKGWYDDVLDRRQRRGEIL